MSQWLRDALLDLLELHMADHIERGCDYNEALMLGVAEIKYQIRGSQGDLVTMLVNDTVLQARYAREAGKFLHKAGTQVH
jgi:hypothetical protein